MNLQLISFQYLGRFSEKARNTDRRRETKIYFTETKGKILRQHG